GLNQMYSLRYGTVPIVRATGGLDDTVDETTGFKFADYTPEALLAVIHQAMGAWQDRKHWSELMRRGMAEDFSWDASAASYQRLTPLWYPNQIDLPESRKLLSAILP